MRGFRLAWKTYVRGNVVSEHARQTIVNFMGACGGSTSHEKDSGAEEKEAAPNMSAPSIHIPLRRVHEMIAQDAAADDAGAGEAAEEQLPPILRAAVDRGEELWGISNEALHSPESALIDTNGNRQDYDPKVRSAGDAAGTKNTVRGQASGAASSQGADDTIRGQASGDQTPSGKTRVQGDRKRSCRVATLYHRFIQGRVDEWLQHVQAQKEPPNKEQLQGITSVVERCAFEAREERRETVNAVPAEPSREMIHGLPGAGKSRLIHWIKELFTEILGREHGVQFVVLASQNTMAALVGGRTLHSWGNIPINKEMAAARKAKAWTKLDAIPMYAKTVHMRLILVDEGSTASAEVLAALNSTLQQSVRATGTYARRHDGTKRPFGGINLRIFTDWWQLPPVNATSITQNPGHKYSNSVQRILAMFWSRDEDSLTGMLELTAEIRCRDPWLSDFLRECRIGEQQWEMYWFVHGLPTDNTGSWMARTGQVACGNEQCAKLSGEVCPQMRREGATDCLVV